MIIRRALYHWLYPAAFLLPLWLLVGWAVFGAGGLAFVWVLFIGAPSVFIAELVLTLLIRSRPSVRASKALGWGDVLAVAVWHALIVLVGFYNALFAPALIGALIAVLAAFSFAGRRLWAQAAPAAIVRQTADGTRYVQPETPSTRPAASPGVFVVEEQPRS